MSIIDKFVHWYIKRNLSPNERASSEISSGQLGQSGGKTFVRILYSRHTSLNVSDHVAQLLFELLRDCKKYNYIRMDKVDNAGPFKNQIHEDIVSPNCKIIIVLAKDSFEINKSHGHENFFQEFVRCTDAIKEKIKEKKVVPVYLLQSTEDCALDDLKTSLLLTIGTYHNKGKLFSEELLTLLFNQNAIDIVEPVGDDVSDLDFREAYKNKLKLKLKKINLLS